MINKGEYRFFLDACNHPAKDKLSIFSKFKEGWHLGEGEIFAAETINQISKLIGECLENGLFDIDVFPGLDGDIRLTIYKMQDYYEFTVGDIIDYRHEKNDIEIEYKRIYDLDDAISKIHDIGKKEWNLFAYSTLHGLTGRLNDIKVCLSYRGRNRYPYLISNAPLRAAGALVTTYSDSTQILHTGT